MKTEEELKIERMQIKRSRTNATVFGIIAVISIISFTYAFFQKAAAEKVKIMAEREVEKCQARATEAEARADVANKKMEQLLIEAQIAKEIAEDANKPKKK